ncbi:MAG: PIG-L family deacetylase [Anaerolineales bacterium]|nr:PIG-L family deacetylase [Anaerolineales bacterium]
MRWIYISPHLDDAALSAGGWIYDQTRLGNRVEIWTVFCGVPAGNELSDFARYLHQLWGMPSARQILTMRRAEDKNAASLLGAKVRHFDFLDCIYRRDKKGNWLYSGVMVEPPPADKNLPREIASALAAHLKADDQVVCQFAIGGHVDHVVTRRAVERLNRPLRYAADLPYYFRAAAELESNARGKEKSVERVSGEGVQLWKEAILEYKSQISSLFPNPRYMRGKINQYLAEFKGIPFWA